MSLFRRLLVVIVTTALSCSVVSAQPSSKSWPIRLSTNPRSLLESSLALRRRMAGSTSGVAPADAVRIQSTGHLYNFLTTDFPGALFSDTIGVEAGKSVGAFSFDNVTLLAFRFNGSRYSIYTVPGSTLTELAAINANGQIAGIYEDTSNQIHGFVDTAGTITTIDYPGAFATEVVDINSLGQLAGLWEDLSFVTHGFTYDGVTFTSLDPPGSVSTEANGINSAGEIVGDYVDASSVQHGFAYLAGKYTTLDIPSATYTTASGINDNGVISGSYGDATTVHGFLFSKGTFNTVDVPGALGTILAHIDNKNHFAGIFVDQAGEVHGMTGH